MRRRTFMMLLSGAAAARPLTARAQQPAMPVIGWLNPRSAGSDTVLVAAFRQGLAESRFIENRTVAIEYRWADGQYDRLPALAADLVRRQVAIIIVGSPPGVAAAKAATQTIPIIFTTGGDPVAAGLVASLNRPGGNITGVYILATELEGKRLEVLRELVPTAATIAILVNPSYREADTQLTNVHEAARSLGLQLHPFKASTEREIAATFAAMANQQVSALLVATDPFFNSRHDAIVALAARHAIPAIYPLPEYVRGGGLMSYGTHIADAYRQCGVYAGLILKGAKAADLPVIQSAKVELIINLKAAKKLGIIFPPALLARADEIIE